jgi:hypothetical protein
LKNAFDILEHDVVPKPHHAIAFTIEISGAYVIRRAAGMLAAVEFDNKAIGVAGKIRKVRPDRCLSSEVRRAGG